ncbi:MAG: hypothetical protein LBQ92_01070 [Propionibacteriaceae bacterium]|jgi:hypothetical protein|nr:hypothetical protein [Propionibacteriaceae bacterium]
MPLAFLPLSPAELREFASSGVLPGKRAARFAGNGGEEEEHTALLAAAQMGAGEGRPVTAVISLAEADGSAVANPRYPDVISLFAPAGDGELLWYGPGEWEELA